MEQQPMIELTGLRINNPQAVLAAFGLTRIMSERGWPVRLHWRETDQRAILEGCEWSQLVEELAAYLDGRERAPELNWADSIKKFSRERYRNLMQQCDARERSWLEAYWYESTHGPASAQRDEELSRSRLDMTSGPIQLFAAVREIIPLLRKKQLERALEEALLQPWLNTDDCSNLGWDPGAIKDGATITGGKLPEKIPHRGVMAAIWLAFETLPWFPARWLAGSRQEISWVLPHQPATANGIRLMLLAQPGLSVQELTAQGWSRWIARIGKNGKYSYLFSATRTWSDRQNPTGSRKTTPAYKAVRME